MKKLSFPNFRRINLLAIGLTVLLGLTNYFFDPFGPDTGNPHSHFFGLITIHTAWLEQIYSLALPFLFLIDVYFNPKRFEERGHSLISALLVILALGAGYESIMVWKLGFAATAIGYLALAVCLVCVGLARLIVSFPIGHQQSGD